ncbi:hypothetical protein FRB93_010567 [Tulasnella sp. JGI-2019a]|nr:hypothetical protein FRB93_010567 [Tulasnella sp. JGI-2019a]
MAIDMGLERQKFSGGNKGPIEDYAVSGQAIFKEFEKLTKPTQVVVRELCELTTTEATWNRILEILRP